MKIYLSNDIANNKSAEQVMVEEVLKQRAIGLTEMIEIV